MQIRVKLFGTLRRLSLKETPGLWEGDVPEGSTISDILSILGAGLYEANAAAINGKPCTLDAIVSENAEIIIVTPMGGG